MGAYLFYKLKDISKAKEASEWLSKSQKQKTLIELEMGLYIRSQIDLDWAIENNNTFYEAEVRRSIGRGDTKVNGVLTKEAEKRGMDEDDMAELWTQAIEELNENFEMQYYAGSCALEMDENYFTLEQMKRITRNGTLLSGRNSEGYRPLMEILTNNPIAQDEDVEITASMVRGIDKMGEDEYLISYSSEYSETPEHDTITLAEARKIFSGFTEEAFRYDVIPYLEGEEADDLVNSLALDSHIISGGKDQEITTGNLAEHYSTMSDNDKCEHIDLIRGLMRKREDEVGDAIKEDTKIANLAHYQSPIIIRDLADLSKEQEQEIKDFGDGNVYGADRYVGQTIFGVKDNLQPIEDFIQEIKNSSFYKFFIETVSNKVENKYIKTDKAFHDFSAKFKTLKDIEENAIIAVDIENTNSFANDDAYYAEVLSKDIDIMNERGALDTSTSVGDDKIANAIADKYRHTKAQREIVSAFYDSQRDVMEKIEAMEKMKNEQNKNQNSVSGNKEEFLNQLEVYEVSLKDFLAYKNNGAKKPSVEIGLAEESDLTEEDVLADLEYLYESAIKDGDTFEDAVQSEYKYGMRIRPFSIGTFPNNDNYIGVEGADIIDGVKYYNILKYGAPLTSDEVKGFELDDLAKLSIGGLHWENIVKTTQYLVSKDLSAKYMRDGFYKQIGMDENEFQTLMSKNGYSDPMDYYDEVERLHSEKTPKVEKAVVVEKQLKLTPYIRTTEAGEELRQIKSATDLNIDGKFIPKGTHGGWIASIDNVGHNSWFSKDVQVWGGVVIEPNTYLDAQIQIKSGEDIVVAEVMTKNKGSRDTSHADNGVSAKLSV